MHILLYLKCDQKVYNFKAATITNNSYRFFCSYEVFLHFCPLLNPIFSTNCCRFEFRISLRLTFVVNSLTISSAISDTWIISAPHFIFFAIFLLCNVLLSSHAFRITYMFYLCAQFEIF